MEKLPIPQFFIGVLCLPKTYDSNSIFASEEKDITANGGILAHENVLEYNHLSYDQFISLFYQVNPRKYLCLHNGKEYSFRNGIFIKEMVSLDNIVPKIDYCVKEQLSVNDALLLFYKLFYSDHHFVYDDVLFDLSRFYIGNLNLCTKAQNHSLDYDREIFYNTIQSNLTFMSSAQLFGSFSADYLSRIYYYEIYRCLFLKFKNNELYNVCNYQNYPVTLISNKENNIFSPGESFCDSFVSFQEEMNRHQIHFDKKMISLRKALSIHKKICVSSIHS